MDKTIKVLTIILLSVLIVFIAAFGGLYFYDKYNDKKAAEEQQRIEEQKRKLDADYALANNIVNSISTAFLSPKSNNSKKNVLYMDTLLGERMSLDSIVCGREEFNKELSNDYYVSNYSNLIQSDNATGAIFITMDILDDNSLAIELEIEGTDIYLNKGIIERNKINKNKLKIGQGVSLSLIGDSCDDVVFKDQDGKTYYMISEGVRHQNFINCTLCDENDNYYLVSAQMTQMFTANVITKNQAYAMADIYNLEP